MEPKFNTSFIPKKSLQADTGAPGSGGKKYVGRRSVHGPGFFLVLLFFISCVIASLGVFGYTVMIDKRIEEFKGTLDGKKSAFKSSVIEDLIAMDLRISQANSLVANHLALSELFNKLEEVTLKRVQYVGFTYTGKTTEAPASMAVSGVAEKLNEAALQTKAYRDDAKLIRPTVQDLEKDDTDSDISSISFQVNTGIDDSLTSFSAALREERLSPVASTFRTLDDEGGGDSAGEADNL